MTTRYIIFSKSSCPFCVAAIEAMQENKLDFKVVNFEPEQESVLKEIKEAHEWGTVPMIFQRSGGDIRFIGGYTDFMNHLETNG
tara:strand:- start:695 stop:946 length:252 start_codon:yes stop_codon:yes gene_type:complete